MKLVSIIIPHYNSSGFLEETLESVFNQTYTNIEIIVVDDDSDSKEWNKLKELQDKWNELILYKRPSFLIKGANSCRNFGLSVAKGYFINFVDSDDILMPDKIEKQVQYFESNPNLGMVVCKTQYFRDRKCNLKSILQKVNFEKNSDYLKLYLSKNAVWCTNSALIKRTSIGEIKFKEGQIDAHEWLFFIFLMLQGIKINGLNDILVLKRIHQDSIGRLNIINKLPSLIESREIIYLKLKNINNTDSVIYTDLVIKDINSLLKTIAKKGQYKLFFKSLKTYHLTLTQKIRAVFIYFIFVIFKKGDTFKIIK
ncbi:glycosyltransferase family 2 protein [Algoriphagus kandeliae]|uniref:Glycosyltransferase family 2 protein n=1 Tax=Algoriphagus kandeliae TaxID=2562278 RepID=A0A4Y9QXN0_9BACT|nr:glycosyltransferase family 2 protein [Algoriphagus kandeliae]TFV97211.1 glycosyltransferase family 2 protein [Algoriphagus kandeliae]